MKILVTGFKPFLGDSFNPSEMLAKDLASQLSSESHVVDSLVLPVEFGRSFEVLRSHLQTTQYDYVLLLGQATGRTKVSFEKVALNWVQSEHADEAGVRPATEAIHKGRELALMTSFSIEKVVAHLKNSDATKSAQVEISFSAGTYVCNDLYYRSLREWPSQKMIFIHVPKVETLPYKASFEILKEAIHFLNQ